MNDSQISVRYAKALFQSARENKVLDEVRNDMEQVYQICDIPEFQYLLENPVLKESQKCSVLESILKKDVHPLSLSLLELTVKNGRDQYIPAIARFFIDLYKKHKGIKTASIVSAYPLPDDLRNKIKKMIETTLESPVELSMEVDEELIGGFVINIDQQQYDASVQNSLKKVKKQLLN